MNNYQSTILISFVLFFYSPIYSKESSLLKKIRNQVEENEKLSKYFLEITSKYGSPKWNYSVEQEITDSKFVITPVINYESNFINGVFYFLENQKGDIDQVFISREQVLKQYVKKKKQRNLIHFQPVIYSFLFLDMKIFNFIDDELTNAISLSDKNSKQLISNFNFDNKLTELFND